MRKLKLIRIKKKKKYKKKELITQRNILFYYMMQLSMIFTTYTNMMKSAKIDAQEELADYFLKFNMDAFITYSGEWFKSKYDITISMDDVKKFTGDWNIYVTETLMPDYNKEMKVIKDKHKTKGQADYFQ